MAQTPIYGLPYPTLLDPPNGADLGRNLAEAVESELSRIDADLARLDDLTDRSGGTYQPTLTATTNNPSLGSGGNFRRWGLWYRQGRLVFAWAVLRFGSSGVNAGSGYYRISLPIPASSQLVTDAAIGAGLQVGDATLRRDSPFSAAVGSVQLTNPTNVQVNLPGSVGAVTNSEPWTWSSGDSISIAVVYIAD